MTFLKDIAEKVIITNASGDVVFTGVNFSQEDLFFLPKGTYIAKIILSSRSFFTQVVDL